MQLVFKTALVHFCITLGVAADSVHCYVKPYLCTCMSENNKECGILIRPYRDISFCKHGKFDSIVTYEQDVLHRF